MKLLIASLLVVLACGDDVNPPTGPGPGQGGHGAQASNGGGGSGAQGQGGSTTVAMGGNGTGGESATDLDDLLERLRADRDGTLLEESYVHGWPVKVAEGLVVVSADPSLAMVAGDFNAWVPEQLQADEDFSWGLLPADQPGQHYKLTNGDEYAADPWSRGFAYDDNGEISLVPAAAAHLERFFRVGQGASSLEPRMVRVLLPEGPASHVLYLHDGQNLFDPGAIWGGWKLTDTAPAGMMLVGIDNTAARMDEYTQVVDDIGGGPIGGLGDEYAALIEEVVRPLVADQYGEPSIVGTLGSSLGGLISLHIGLTYPSTYDFVGSMSGTLGWGSIGPSTGETMIEHFAAAPIQPFVVYLDSGGNGPCADSDGDGIDDDGAGSDNYCETVQMRDVLAGEGYVFDDNLFHWHEAGAEHNEQFWAARVFRPLDIFAAIR